MYIFDVISPEAEGDGPFMPLGSDRPEMDGNPANSPGLRNSS